jgi:hypothetical protein
MGLNDTFTCLPGKLQKYQRLSCAETKTPVGEQPDDLYGCATLDFGWLALSAIRNCMQIQLLGIHAACARSDIFHEIGFAQKTNLTTDEHGWRGFANSKKVLLNFLDPCKSLLSVLSVVRFCVFVHSMKNTCREAPPRRAAQNFSSAPPWDR